MIPWLPLHSHANPSAPRHFLLLTNVQNSLATKATSTMNVSVTNTAKFVINCPVDAHLTTIRRTPHPLNAQNACADRDNHNHLSINEQRASFFAPTCHHCRRQLKHFNTTARFSGCRSCCQHGERK